MTITSQFQKIRTGFFVSIIIALTILVAYIFRPFFFPIFWAMVISILFYPLYEKFRRFFRVPTVSSIFTIMVVIAVIILPLCLIGTLVWHQAYGLYQNVTSTQTVGGNIAQVGENLRGTVLFPAVEAVSSSWDTYAADFASNATGTLLSSAKNITQNTLRFVFMLFVMCYALFYFFKDGPDLLRRIMHFSPVGNVYEEMLYERFTSTVRATIKGTLIVGSIQGLLGSLLFWAVGVPGAFVWGVVMTGFAVIPAVGPSVIWLPAGLIQLAMGHTTAGIIILVCGALIISLIDNILRPKLIGEDTQMHPLMAFFATLGGILAFGISGFVIGPVIASLYLATLSIYSHYYKTDLNRLENN